MMPRMDPVRGNDAEYDARDTVLMPFDCRLVWYLAPGLRCLWLWVAIVWEPGVPQSIVGVMFMMRMTMKTTAYKVECRHLKVPIMTMG
jgi:hypothetical protein